MRLTRLLKRMMMRLSEYGEIKIKEFEGLRLKAYRCSGGVLTIGWGHTGKVSKMPISEGLEIDEAHAQQLFEWDVENIEKRLYAEPYADALSDGQWDALVSFIFNLGWGNFAASTLRKKLLKDIDDASIPDEFRRWVYADGKKLKGLITRREWEAQSYEWA